MKRVRAFLIVCALTAVPALAGEGNIQRSPRAVPGEYVVTFAPSVSAEAVPALADELARANGGEVKAVWNQAVNGCVLTLPEACALEASRDPRVASIEENAEWSLSGMSYTFIDPETGNGVWYNRLWYLDRVDQMIPDLEGTYNNYSTGSGVNIYIVDLGVWAHHQEFLTAAGQSRVTAGFDASGEGQYATSPCANYQPFRFNFSHGTAVASIAAGKTVGLTPEATIIPVKVARCDNNQFATEMVIGGLNWILTPYDPFTRTGNPDCYLNGSGARRFHHPTVINMSFYLNPYVGTGAAGVTTALDSLNNAGAILVASANNQYVDACLTLPARHSRGSWNSPGNVITVGGTMLDKSAYVLGQPIPGAPPPVRESSHDLFWTIAPNSTSDSTPHSLGCKPAASDSNFSEWTEGSNYGPCVTILAPAKNIAGAFYNGTDVPNLYRDAQQNRGAGLVVVNGQTCTGSDPRSNYALASGTSFAAPIVTGVIAQYLQHNPSATPDDAYWAVRNNGLWGIVQNVPAGTPNVLVHQFQ
jgi:subtilisin family serine protease